MQMMQCQLCKIITAHGKMICVASSLHFAQFVSNVIMEVE